MTIVSPSASTGISNSILFASTFSYSCEDFMTFQNPQGCSTRRMTTARKVLAYVTRGRRLLVFRQPESPEAGIQVPAGTVEEGEGPEVAVLREAREETGLDGLRLDAFLGALRIGADEAPAARPTVR